MTINKDMLRQPEFWRVAIPCLLLLWALSATRSMYAQKQSARDQLKTTAKVMRDARAIAAILDQLGTRKDRIARNRPFDSVASARECAHAAGIPEARLSRGESSSPKKNKDGSIRIIESFKLRNSQLLQIARFIDYAEQNFASLTCTQITITNSRNRRKNNWDADLTFQYLRTRPSP